MFKSILLLPALLIAPVLPVMAQSSPSITFYELPAFLGRSATVSAETPDLATQSFAKRAQSARVVGEWQVCSSTKYAGGCQTLTADTPLLRKANVVSARPTGASATTASGAVPTAASAGAAASVSAGATVDLSKLDATGAVEGQDVAFFAQPKLGTDGVSAGSNDMSAATAFCKEAGYTTAAHAGRARAQASGLIDISAKATVRGFALRDVLCRR